MGKAELMQMAMEPKERGITVTLDSMSRVSNMLMKPKQQGMKHIILVPSHYTDQQIDDLYRDYYNPDYIDIHRVAPIPTPIPTNVFKLGKKDWRTELIGARKC